MLLGETEVSQLGVENQAIHSPEVRSSRLKIMVEESMPSIINAHGWMVTRNQAQDQHRREFPTHPQAKLVRRVLIEPS